MNSLGASSDCFFNIFWEAQFVVNLNNQTLRVCTFSSNLSFSCIVGFQSVSDGFMQIKSVAVLFLFFAVLLFVVVLHDKLIQSNYLAARYSPICLCFFTFVLFFH